jgi:hypothetical protein
LKKKGKLKKKKSNFGKTKGKGGKLEKIMKKCKKKKRRRLHCRKKFTMQNI